MILKQEQASHRRVFELKTNTLLIKTKSLGESKEWSVDLLNIGEDKFYITYSRVGPKILGSFFFVIVIATIIAFILEGDKMANLPILLMAIVFMGGLGLLAFKSPMKNELHLRGGSERIMFLYNSPSKEEMEAFIDALTKRTHEILLEKYGGIDPDLPEETQINNLYWLKERGLFSEEKYKELKQEYRERRLMT